MGRLRKLQDLRQQRRQLIAPPGTVKLPGGTPAHQRPAGDRGRGDRQELRRAARSCSRFSTRILRGDRVGVARPQRRRQDHAAEAADRRARAGQRHGAARHRPGDRPLRPAPRPARPRADALGDPVPARRRPGPGAWAVSRHVVGYLRDFLFRDEQARQPVRALSGGERNRLLLAKILAQPANLLILDEPTNDLDIETLDLLEEMLADYRGHAAPGQPRPRLRRPAGDLDHRVRGRRAARASMPAATATGCASGRHRRPPQAGAAARPRPGTAAAPARLRRQAAARAGPAARPHRRARGARSPRSRRGWPIPGSTPATRPPSPAPRDELERLRARARGARGALAGAGGAARGRGRLTRPATASRAQ